MPDAEKRRVLVVGLDGVSFDVIDPLIDTGRMPNLARLLAVGARADLRSTTPWQTPVAWASFATGVNPGAHGVYGWWQPDLDAERLVPSGGRQIDDARFWEVLSSAGSTVAVVNVPMTYPARPVNGFTIAGLDSPFSAPEDDPLLCYPRRFVTNLRANGVPYRVMPEPIAGESHPDAAARWIEVERTRVDAVVAALDDFRADFVQVNLFMTDYVAHRSLPDDPVLDETYVAADELVGRLWAAVGDDFDVFVVSDHGSAPVTTFVMIHNLLRDLGLLAFGPWLADEQVRGVLPADAPASEVDELVARMRRVGPALRQKLYEEVADKHPGANVGFSTIDWNVTRAYCTSDYGQVRLNRERGTAAVASTAEADRVLAKVRAALLALRASDGAPIVDVVVDRDVLYRGRNAAAGPDLTPLPTSNGTYFCQVYSFYLSGLREVVLPGSNVVDPVETGTARDHSPLGILLAGGPSITARGGLSAASILDMAPTMLSLFGLEPLPEHEGVVLADLFGGERPQAAGPTDAGPYREGLRERLMSLGYRI